MLRSSPPYRRRLVCEQKLLGKAITAVLLQLKALRGMFGILAGRHSGVSELNFRLPPDTPVFLNRITRPLSSALHRGRLPPGLDCKLPRLETRPPACCPQPSARDFTRKCTYSSCFPANDPREPLPDVRYVDHACTPGGASGSTTVTHRPTHRPTRGRRPPCLPRRGSQEELGGHEPFLAGEAPTPPPCIHAGQDPLPRALAEAAISTLSSGSCSREQLGRWHLEAQDYFYMAICPRPGLAGSDRPKESRGRWETPGQLRMHGPAPRAVLGRLEMWCEDREETRVP
nr:uncharacterized protein LOC105086477 [Camelus dromedarius]